MNSPAVLRINGAASLFSFRQRPGDMNLHTWYNAHGEDRKMAHRNGSLIQMMEKLSIGLIMASRGVLTCRYFRASIAGSLMISQSSFANTMLSMNATPKPHRHLII